MSQNGSTALNARLGEVTQRIVNRSHDGRQRYLDRIAAAAEAGPRRQRLGCANQAHGFAACGVGDKSMLRDGGGANLAIVTAYNDMLSAHQPYETYPEMIRRAAREAGGVAQVAGVRAGHVRRHHARRGRHGTVAVLARSHRARDRRLALASDLRRRRLSRHLRQDRAGPRHRGASLRTSAGGSSSGRADDLRAPQRPESQDPAALRRGQGRSCRPAGGGGRILSRPRDLHVLTAPPIPTR